MSEGKKIQKIKHTPIAALFILFSIWVAIKSISPTSDSVYATAWFTQIDSYRFFKVLCSVWSGCVPIPALHESNFWNSSIFSYDSATSAGRSVLVLFSILFLVYNTLLFSKKAAVLLFYLSATFGILLFFYTSTPIFTLYAKRYHGFIFIIYIVSIWLLNYFPEKKATTIFILTNLSNKLNVKRYQKYVLFFLLSINVLASGIVFWLDYKSDFSSVKKTGKYIVEHNLQRYAAAGFVDYAVSPISAFTRKPFYYPDRDVTSTFPVWTVKNYTTDFNQGIYRLLNYISKSNDSVLVVLNFDLNTTMIGDIQFRYLESFKGAVVADENFTLYLASKFDIDRDLNNLPAQLTKEQVMTYLNLMGGLFQQNNVAACSKIMEALSSRMNETSIPRYHMYKGMLLAKQGDLPGAKKELSEEISLNLQKDESYFQLGMLYYQEQKMDSALYCWEESAKLNPNNADAFSNIGVVYFNFKKDYPKAGEAWQRAIQINPRYFQVYVNLMMNCQAIKDENCFITFLKAALANGMSLEEIRSKGIQVNDQMLAKVKQ